MLGAVFKMTVHPSTILVGLESAGKSALFHGLTGGFSDEANFRGSTVVCRRCYSKVCGCELIDSPGIRLQGDSVTTREALGTLKSNERVVLVVRGTHFVSELQHLLRTVEVGNKAVALVVTFADRAVSGLRQTVAAYAQSLGISYAVVNARCIDDVAKGEVSSAVASARPIESRSLPRSLPSLVETRPDATLFENRSLGPWLALFSVILIFAVPVMLAFKMSAALQIPMDALLIQPLVSSMENLPPLVVALLAGSYGVLTLGWYSFLWAFPVVVLISIGTAITEETGLKDRICAALDPWLRQIGLSGRDLIPVLTGFGCNVVAVMQTRSCSSCTRKSCVSLISFGSACSYQIGASISVFGSAGQPWLFVPFLVVLFVVGALHTRVWHGALAKASSVALPERAFLQWPAWRAVSHRLFAVIRMFLLQAMPIFLLMCLVAAALQFTGLLNALASSLGPSLAIFHLPPEVLPAVVFSIMRKDGLLVLNADDGALLAMLSGSQVFVLVYLASTLTACLVTVWTIRRELGWRAAGEVTGRQLLTCLISTLFLSILLRWLPI